MNQRTNIIWTEQRAREEKARWFTEKTDVYQFIEAQAFLIYMGEPYSQSFLGIISEDGRNIDWDMVDRMWASPILKK